MAALDALGEPTARRDPLAPLRWTSKSTRQLAAELTRPGQRVSPMQVCKRLKRLGYSLQGTRQVKEGASPPDRAAQFEYSTEQVKTFQHKGQPVVAVAANKQE